MIETAGTSPQSQKTLLGERVTFTGTLASMTHRQAAQMAETHGGTAAQHVSKQITMLVIGEEGWPLEADGTPSVKLQQVNRLRDEGLPIRIVSESDWLDVLGLHDHLQEVRRHYTPAMLSQMLNVPVAVIRNWERCGLIRPVKHVLRLPYFDFREVAGARRLHELLKSGVTRRQIVDSLKHLRNWVGGTERPLAQLEFLADDGELIYRDKSGPLDPRSGQRLFDFDSPQEETAPAELALTAGVIPMDGATQSAQEQATWTPEQWFQLANQHLEEHRLDDAVEAFRLCLLDWHQRAEVHFQLADTLYRMDNLMGALERYHMAVELEPNYLEAWTQLGCVYSETQKPEAAIQAFRIAIDLHADYPDAHWHLAQILESQGQAAAAKPHWEAYLQFDQRGPWADIAREHLV
ncbi:MAG: Tetratricopeptide 2 repeat protein [Planctomycetaceae bacterium]|nr:Tetratricopeptide 2 repeat protein [Planctomycetaceae bacterium]